jgi:hypothetical protein
MRKSKLNKKKGKLQDQRDKEYNCKLTGGISKKPR